MNISEEIKNNLLLELTNKTKSIYNELLLNYLKISFEDYLNDLVTQIIDSLEYFETIDINILEPVIKRRQKTKLRWVNALSNSNSPLKKELSIAESLFNDVLKGNIEKFRNVYNAADPKELKNKILHEINNWNKHDEKLLIDFKYLKRKQKKSIKPALDNDITYIALCYLYKTFEDTNLVNLPETYTNIPVDIGKRKHLDLNETITVDNKEYLVDTYEIEDETVFKTLVGTEELRKEALARAVFKAFNITDSKIFAYIMSLVNPETFTSQTIVVRISSIVKNVFDSDGAKNYKIVKDSLIKMALIRCMVTNKKRNGFVFALFDKVIITEEVMTQDPSSKGKTAEVATIKISDCIISDCVNKKTISVYKDKFTKLSDAANILVIQLQKIRFSLFNREYENKKLKTIITYSTFRAFIRCTKTKSNYNSIINKLTEIKSNQIIIKDFKVKGDTFFIEFYPLSEKEKRNLFKKISFSNNTKEILTIE